MKCIDESRLESDLEYRFQFLVEFMEFSDEDVATIHAMASILDSQIPEIVQATYDKLLAYDATARHFLQRQHGYKGPLPGELANLSQSADQIQFRKEHLRRYLTNLLGNPYDTRMTKYLDMVGKMHTPKAGNQRIDVPLVQMNALMGLLADVLIRAIEQCGLEQTIERRTIRAFSKLLWIQNDLINRHYASPTGANNSNSSSPVANPPAASAWR